MRRCTLLERSLARLREDPTVGTWWLYYIVLEQEKNPLVVGAVGYKGPPDSEGTVEVGYGVLPEFQRRGIASEATMGLIANAFEHAVVKRVIAETLPELVASIGVMEKCGLVFIGEGSEARVIRYELSREAFESGRSKQE